jgi:hypothetical protein
MPLPKAGPGRNHVEIEKSENPNPHMHVVRPSQRVEHSVAIPN